jgi:DNA-3-methyladenine glycosylase II
VAETILTGEIVVYGKQKFPSPEQITAMDDLKLRGCGLSNAKVKYVKDLSIKVMDGLLKFTFSTLPDDEIP